MYTGYEVSSERNEIDMCISKTEDCIESFSFAHLDSVYNNSDCSLDSSSGENSFTQKRIKESKFEKCYSWKEYIKRKAQTYFN